ncbi:MAG: PfkB family carbohydrate kinase [Dehalococcoidia bacterium]
MSAERLVPEFTVIGHVTRDVVGDDVRAGGTASYAAVVAARLGLRTAVLTSAADDLLLPPELAGVDIVRLPSARTTVFEHRWYGRVREQYVRSRADPIGLDGVPEALLQCPVVLFGPLVGEVDAELLRGFSAALRGATLQGWLRTTDAEEHLEPIDVSAWDHLPVLTAVDMAFLSPEDIGGPSARAEALLQAWSQTVPLLAVTEGDAGARIAIDGRWRRVGAFPADEVDGTGAGDAFAAGFLIRYHETADAAEAARFASAVASFVVEASGISGAPTRAQVQARLNAHSEVRLE